MKLLTLIEKTGNKLPDPASLFVIGTIVVFILSALISSLSWSVVDPKGQSINAFNLISSDGTWWFLSTMVKNFIGFPPLGIVLVGMLGIGLAERTGFLPALLQFLLFFHLLFFFALLFPLAPGKPTCDLATSSIFFFFPFCVRLQS